MKTVVFVMPRHALTGRRTKEEIKIGGIGLCFEPLLGSTVLNIQLLFFVLFLVFYHMTCCAAG